MRVCRADEYGLWNESMKQPSNGDHWVNSPAGFRRRFWARLVDLVLTLAVVGVAALFFEEVESSDQWWWWLSEPIGLWGLGKVPIIIIVVAEATYQAVAVVLCSTTIGKWILGVFVRRMDGSSLGPLRATIRAFAFSMQFWLPMIAIFGAIILAFREDKRGLHDLLCDTEVVTR